MPKSGALADQDMGLVKSDGRWTSDGAIRSTPSSRLKTGSARSFAVSGDTSSTVPWRVDTFAVTDPAARRNLNVEIGIA